MKKKKLPHHCPGSFEQYILHFPKSWKINGEKRSQAESCSVLFFSELFSKINFEYFGNW